MKILLLNPSFKTKTVKGFERYYVRSGSRWPHPGVKSTRMLPHYIPFPFFLACCAAFLKKDGFDVFVLDCVGLDMGEGQLREKFRQIGPDLVFWEPLQSCFERDVGFAGFARKNGCRVVWGGAYASVAEDDTTAGAGVDFCIQGEYEKTLLKLCRHLRGDAEQIPAGVKTFTGEGVLFSGPAVPDENLDSWPDPAFECFPSSDFSDLSRYWDGFCQSRPAVQLLSSRGCRYGCSFCVWNQVLYRRCGFRALSAERMVAQVKLAREKFHAREIYFDDDDFATDRQRVVDFCRELDVAGIKTRWSCMASAASLDTELAGLMARAGCVGVKIGVESLCPAVLKTLGKPVDAGHIKSLVDTFSSYGVKVHATFITGLPEETPEGFESTLEFLKSFDVDSIQVSAATAFAGTAFYDKIHNHSGRGCGTSCTLGATLPLAGVKRQLLVRTWLLGRLFSPVWVWRQCRRFFRVVAGCGPWFVVCQLVGIIIDETGCGCGTEENNSCNS